MLWYGSDSNTWPSDVLRSTLSQALLQETSDKWDWFYSGAIWDMLLNRSTSMSAIDCIMFIKMDQLGVEHLLWFSADYPINWWLKRECCQLATFWQTCSHAWFTFLANMFPCMVHISGKHVPMHGSHFWQTCSHAWFTFLANMFPCMVHISGKHVPMHGS